ncbi:histidine kinase [Noviherbaspirillum sp.]|jgi:signal transduction histidine kinase|uniref:sensor histidine kinase n=1 Tax=Noviherbaspirillum sp. TaxID=1926288 RepID=UPI0025EC8775|nr:histidine kinase [Noviherbaspirillum sp.]
MPETRYQEPSWRARIVVTLLISAIAGAFSLPSKASMQAFWVVQLYAQCTGFSILTVYTAVRYFFPQSDTFSWMRLVILMAAIPVGYECGMALAAFLHGDPIRLGAIFRVSRLGLLTLLTVVIFIMILGGSRLQVFQLAAETSEAQRLAAEARLRLLQAQLEPHMLFNTLANLHSLIEVDAPRAQLMVEHLIEFMRFLLSASRKEKVNLQEEFRLITAYLKLMSVRMDSRLTYELSLPDDLESASVPAMLLQPLVENAIKHGLAPKVGGGTIRIAAERQGKDLTLSVIDNGVGIGNSMDGERYGTSHVVERLRILYGDRAQLTLEALPGGGVCARVRLPL